MKLFRNLLYGLGVLLILLNIVALLIGFPSLKQMYSEMTDAPEKLGFIIGNFLFLMLGVLLLSFAARIHKKIKRKKLQAELLDSLP